MKLVTVLGGAALVLAWSSGSTSAASARTVTLGELAPALDSMDLAMNVRAGGRGGGARGGGARVGGAHVSGARVGGAAVHRGTVVRGGAAVGGAAAVRRTSVAVARPVRPWVRRPYYGRVVGGVALGTLIAVSAGAVPAAPASDLCWYWADPSQTQGYWDYCR
jgi:hypothetical protein